MSSFKRENADQNEQRNTEVTHCCQQTTTTISYIGRILYHTDQRQQEENTDRKSINNRKELCYHFTCTKICSTGCTFFYEKTTNMTAVESACVNQGSNSEQHAVNQNNKIISEQQCLKQGSNNKQTEQQSLKQDNRKRSADQSLKSKEQIVREVVPTTNHSQSTADTAGTFDRIFNILMAQIEQLRSLLTEENPGAKKIARKMITLIKVQRATLELELHTQ